MNIVLGETITLQESHGLLDGCGFAAIRLSEQSASQISQRGLAYFSELTRGRNGERLSAWKETPVEMRESDANPGTSSAVSSEGDHIFAYSVWSCDNSNTGHLRATMGAIEQPGSYYTTFNRGEGLLYVLPAQRLVIYAYFG